MFISLSLVPVSNGTTTTTTTTPQIWKFKIQVLDKSIQHHLSSNPIVLTYLKFHLLINSKIKFQIKLFLKNNIISSKKKQIYIFFSLQLHTVNENVLKNLIFVNPKRNFKVLNGNLFLFLPTQTKC